MLSPLDGRYSSQCQELAFAISEEAIIYLMYLAEVEWLTYLTRILPKIDPLEKDHLLLDSEETIVREVRQLEKETKHEVKAVEMLLRRKLTLKGMGRYAELVHFGLTSEDTTNIAYASAIKKSIRILEATLFQLLECLSAQALAYSNIVMLARTHGQPASPTTLGKEIRVFERRLALQVESLRSIDAVVKINGATGNYNAMYIAYPDLDWITLCKDFIRGVSGFQFSLHTTQVESHDWLAAALQALSRINTVLVGLSRDMWQYISVGYFELRVNRVGSSTMPHKINPIEFENAEGNLELANALLSFLAGRLPLSRLQRDLSGSTIKRNIGVAFGHCIVGYKAILGGLQSLEANKSAISCDLDNHYEILAEAYQTILRKNGIQNAYEKIRVIFSDSPDSKTVEARLRKVITDLRIPEDDRNRLLQLTPCTYTGVAESLACIGHSY
jgi:adenylosuccinate lyase